MFLVLTPKVAFAHLPTLELEEVTCGGLGRGAIVTVEDLDGPRNEEMRAARPKMNIRQVTAIPLESMRWEVKKVNLIVTTYLT